MPADRESRVVKWRLFVIASYAATLALLGASFAYAGQAEHPRAYSCTYLPGKRLCVDQAPRDVCRHALHERVCWWYTGTRHQIVFDHAGNVASFGNP